MLRDIITTDDAIHPNPYERPTILTKEQCRAMANAATDPELARCLANTLAVVRGTPTAAA